MIDQEALHEKRKAIERELEAFPGRTDALNALMRWERYPLMYYRTDLHVHGKRIVSTLIAAASVIEETIPEFDFDRAILLALVHDDAELVMGDFQSANRVLMTKEELD